MRITSIQLEIRDRPKAENLALALKKLDEAPKSDLMLLPEIWTVGFFAFGRYRIEAETIDGPVVTAFRERASHKKCYLHMGSFVEEQDGAYYNTSLLLDPNGEITAKYRKVHLFGYQSQERQILTPGQEITTAETPFGIMGMSTCYDLRFPELFRKMIDRGATIFLVTSAWPMVRLESWQLFNRVRSIENLSFLISCNCAGVTGENHYAGNSAIIGPQGQVLAEGGSGPGYITAEIDPGQAVAVRQTFPALEDRVFR